MDYSSILVNPKANNIKIDFNITLELLTLHKISWKDIQKFYDIQDIYRQCSNNYFYITHNRYEYDYALMFDNNMIHIPREVLNDYIIILLHTIEGYGYTFSNDFLVDDYEYAVNVSHGFGICHKLVGKTTNESIALYTMEFHARDYIYLNAKLCMNPKILLSRNICYSLDHIPKLLGQFIHLVPACFIKTHFTLGF